MVLNTSSRYFTNTCAITVIAISKKQEPSQTFKRVHVFMYTIYIVICTCTVLYIINMEVHERPPMIMKILRWHVWFLIKPQCMRIPLIEWLQVKLCKQQADCGLEARQLGLIHHAAAYFRTTGLTSSAQHIFQPNLSCSMLQIFISTLVE